MLTSREKFEVISPLEYSAVIRRNVEATRTNQELRNIFRVVATHKSATTYSCSFPAPVRLRMRTSWLQPRVAPVTRSLISVGRCVWSTTERTLYEPSMLSAANPPFLITNILFCGSEITAAWFWETWTTINPKNSMTVSETGKS